MSYLKQNADDLLKAKFNKTVARVTCRLSGSIKAKFYEDLVKNDVPESKKVLECIKFYYQNHPEQLKNKY